MVSRIVRVRATSSLLRMSAMEWMDYSCRPGLRRGDMPETPMTDRPSQSRRRFIQAGAATAASALMPFTARAADPIKVGLILPLTGPFASTGRQVEAAVRLYLARNGDT